MLQSPRHSKNSGPSNILKSIFCCNVLGFGHKFSPDIYKAHYNEEIFRFSFWFRNLVLPYLERLLCLQTLQRTMSVASLCTSSIQLKRLFLESNRQIFLPSVDQQQGRQYHDRRTRDNSYPKNGIRSGASNSWHVPH